MKYQLSIKDNDDMVISTMESSIPEDIDLHIERFKKSEKYKAAMKKEPEPPF